MLVCEVLAFVRLGLTDSLVIRDERRSSSVGVSPSGRTDASLAKRMSLGTPSRVLVMLKIF